MGDLVRHSAQYTISPNAAVDIKWTEARIQELKSRRLRILQDIEDLQQGKIKELEGHAMMLEREMVLMQDKLDQRKAAVEGELTNG